MGLANLRPEVHDRMTLEHQQEEVEGAKNDDYYHNTPDCNFFAGPDANPVEEITNAGFQDGG